MVNLDLQVQLNFISFFNSQVTYKLGQTSEHAYFRTKFVCINVNLVLWAVFSVGIANKKENERMLNLVVRLIPIHERLPVFKTLCISNFSGSIERWLTSIFAHHH